MEQKRILLVIGGGIAAYKSLELIRELGRRGIASRCIVTRAGQEFVTPLSVSALSGEKAYTELFDLDDEAEMGHIQLSRSADLVVVCPATADLMAKANAGLANDLASTMLLATDKPVLMAPAMNVRMWQHAATIRNVAQLRADGVTVMEPDEGAMACGEFGPGRLPDVPAIVAAIEAQLKGPGQGALAISRTIPPAARAMRSPPHLPQRGQASRWFPVLSRLPHHVVSHWCRSKRPARCSRPARMHCPPTCSSLSRPSPTGGLHARRPRS